MAEERQFYRNDNLGDYTITGESSNGINITKDGNIFHYTGNSPEELEELRKQGYDGKIDINDPNKVASFIGMYRSGGSNINLGNPNQQSINLKNTPNQNQNIITPAITITPTPLPSVEPTFTPTPTPTPVPKNIDTGSIEDIQELNFDALPEDEGFQLIRNLELEEFEESVENETNNPTPFIDDVKRSDVRISQTGGGGVPTYEGGGEIGIISGKVGASAYPAPPDWRGVYQNAKIPLSALVGVAKGGRDKYIYQGTKGWHLLHPEAARQYLAFKAYANSQNIRFTLSSAYRDLAHQISLGSGSTVATPGYSPHGWGGAVDISEIYAAVPGPKGEKGYPRNNAIARQSSLYQWFAANAPKFGFYNPYRLADGRGVDEAWHWEYWGFYTNGTPQTAGKNDDPYITYNIDKNIPASIIWGGIDFATPSWMASQIPESLKTSKKIIIAPYTKSLQDIQTKYPNLKINSVSGFSAGGSQAWIYAGVYKFTGLIDPSTNASAIAKAQAWPNVIMMYNNSNWTGQYAAIGTALVDAAAKMGSSAVKVNLKHALIPAEFFKKYGSNL